MVCYSVEKTGIKIVMKNNKPEYILISSEDHVKMIDQLNDAKLLILVNERMFDKYIVDIIRCLFCYGYILKLVYLSLNLPFV